MEESRCQDCTGKYLQCFTCKKIDDDTRKAVKNSLKKKKSRPMSTDELKQGRFLDLVSNQFFVKEISGDGHCLFAAFAAGIKKVNGEDVTVKSLRSKVADVLLSSRGKVPGMLYDQFVQLSDGRIVTDPSASLQSHRNVGLKPIQVVHYNSVLSFAYAVGLRAIWNTRFRSP